MIHLPLPLRHLILEATRATEDQVRRDIAAFKALSPEEQDATMNNVLEPDA